MVLGIEDDFYIKTVWLRPVLVVLSIISTLLVVLLYTVSRVIFLGIVDIVYFCFIYGRDMTEFETMKVLGDLALLVVRMDNMYFSIDY